MNTHESVNRTRKAVKLADTLHTLISRTGASLDDIAELPDSAWLTVAQVAKVRVPSAATRAMVLELLRHETGERPCRFAGVEGHQHARRDGRPADSLNCHAEHAAQASEQGAALRGAEDAAKSERVAS